MHLRPRRTEPVNMSHLSTDRLAALGDESPTAAEAEHLAECASCAREREAYRALVSMARAERDSIGLPLTRWDSIAAALADDERVAARLENASLPQVVVRSRGSSFVRMSMRAAAAVLLVAGGLVAGRVSAGARALPLSSESANAPVAQTRASNGHRNAVSTSVTGVSDPATFASVEEARLAQQRSEAVYQEAAAFLAQHDTTGASDGSPVAYRSRLAAFDQVISTMQGAMHEAPHDPVINGYYLTTLGQREATLRQMNTVLPVSLRANSF
jgi:hypothetical protein